MKAANILRWGGCFPKFNYGYIYNGYVVTNEPINGGLITSLLTPTLAQTNTLISYLGGLSATGGNLKEPECFHWDLPNEITANQYGFNAYGAGIREENPGVATFSNFRTSGIFWTSEFSASKMTLITITNLLKSATITPADRVNSISIRCMRNLTAQEQIDYSDGDVVESKLDYNGNSYDVIRIGTQGWTNSNLRAGNYLNGTSIPLNPSTSGFYLNPGRWYPNNNISNV